MELSNHVGRFVRQWRTRTPWALVLAPLVCGACSSSTERAPPTTWGSELASLVLDGNKTTVKVP